MSAEDSEVYLEEFSDWLALSSTVQENHLRKAAVYVQSHWSCDDVYLDNSWARVMVGNASTLIDSHHIEPQIPSAWSDTEIVATVNRGTFNAGDTAYLFVVDANGSVSNGHQITFSEARRYRYGSSLVHHEEE